MIISTIKKNYKSTFFFNTKYFGGKKGVFKVYFIRKRNKYALMKFDKY